MARRSLWWVGLETLSLTAVSFAVLTALARYLSPDDFGRAAMALALVQIAASVVESLFLDAIVQRKDLRAAQADGAHSASLVLGVGLALAIGAVAWVGGTGIGLGSLAPAGGSGFDATSALGLAACMAPSIVFAGATAVPLARLRRDLALREVAIVTGLARGIGGAAAVACMVGGLGVWGLVVHQNLSALLLLVLLVARGHAGGRWTASPRPAGALLRFALVSSLHGLLTSNRSRAFQLLAATVMPAAAVGQLALALRLVEMLAAVVVTGVARVALARLADLAHGGRDAVAGFLSMTRRFAALATPIFLLLSALAVPLVRWVGADQWAGAGELVMWFALAQALRAPVHLAAPLFAALARPQLNLLIVLVEIAALAALVLAWHDPLAWVARLAVVLPLTVWLLARTAGVGTTALLRSVVEPFVAALAMWFAVRALLPWLVPPAWPLLATLTLGAAVGALVYAALLALTWRGAWGALRGSAHPT